MKKIRLGNDIQFNWTLLNSEGEPYSLEGADLRITYTTFRGVTEVTDFSVSGNVVSWTFKGKDQKILGDYIVTLQQNAGEDNMLTVDKCDAFRLVARSCDAGGETACSHLQIETVDITSTLDVQQIATGGTAKWNEIEGKPENFADWNAEEGNEKFISNKPTIPSKTSDLQNDSNFATKDELPDTSGFITNAVNNLVNYYLKEETYTKQEVVALINQITTINFKVVDVLPDTGEANLIYLVKKEGSGDDVHDEYIWVESKWEKIGSTTVDLTNYYTKTDADGRFALKTSIADMLTKTEAAEIYISEAPKDGKTYGRNNGAWVKVESGGGSTSEPPAGGYNRSLFEAAGAVYNEETGFYELNGLTDITEDEMTDIFVAGECNFSSNNDGFYSHKEIRTNISRIIPYNIALSGVFRQSLIEVAKIPGGPVDNNCFNSFYMCRNLRKILIDSNSGQKLLNITKATTNAKTLFIGCTNLEEVDVLLPTGANVEIKFSDSPKLNYQSFKSMIDLTNAENKRIITVHPTTYSYLTGTAEPTELVGGTTEEWQALVATAAEKQISFATE